MSLYVCMCARRFFSRMDVTCATAMDAYDYDSSGRGGNRFATILLYMSDLQDEDGGETVFSQAPPAGETTLRPTPDVVRELRSSGNTLDLLTPNSWEEDMAAKCTSRLAVKPHKSRAVLFYSQHPNGEPDEMSKHGGCPVLGGTKWYVIFPEYGMSVCLGTHLFLCTSSRPFRAANLWAWNAARSDFEYAPFKPGRDPDGPRGFNQVKATFRNTGKDARFNDAELYYEESGFFGSLGAKQAVAVNTYRTHVWNIISKSTGEILKTFTIVDDSKPELLFEV